MMSLPALALILWTFVSPCVVVVLVAGVGVVGRFVARAYLACVPLGWFAMGAMVYGTVALHGAAQVLVVAAAAPLTGLAIWVRGRGGYEPGEPFEPAPPPSPPPARERQKPQPSLAPADCEWRTHGHAGRTTSRRGAIPVPSRTRSSA